MLSPPSPMAVSKLIHLYHHQVRQPIGVQVGRHHGTTIKFKSHAKQIADVQIHAFSLVKQQGVVFVTIPGNLFAQPLHATVVHFLH